MKLRLVLLWSTIGLLLVSTPPLLQRMNSVKVKGSVDASATKPKADNAAPKPEKVESAETPSTSVHGKERDVESFNQWLRKWKSKALSGAQTNVLPGEIEEGLQLAIARRAFMEERLRKDPASALEHALKWHEWLALPQQLREWVEEPFSETADLRVRSDCRPVAARTEPWQSHYLEMRGDSFAAFVYGRRREMTTKLGVPLQGIRLGQAVALWESPAQLLTEEEETRAASQVFPEGNAKDHSWVSGQPIAGKPTVALVGGRVHYFASEEEVQVVKIAIMDAERRLGPHNVVKAMAAMAESSRTFNPEIFGAAASLAPSTWTETPKTVLCLRLNTPSAPAPYPQTILRSLIDGSSNVLRMMSYGKTWLVPTVPTNVFPLSQNVYSSEATLHNEADALASAAGLHPADYNLVLYSFPSQPFAWAGLSDYGGNHVHINGAQPESVFTHEFGHSYGLGHANFWFGLTGAGFLARWNPDGSLMEFVEYGDIFDIMGGDRYTQLDGTPYYPSNHYSMFSKAVLNWIEPTEVSDVTSDGVYRVYRFDHPDARLSPGRQLALRVRGPDTEELWVGYRRSIPNNASTANGAYIVWAPAPGTHRLINTRPLSMPNALFDNANEDAPLPPCRSYTDPSGRIRITNLRAAGTAPNEYLDIQVEFLSETSPAYELFTDTSRTTPGLRGSYVNRSLGSYTPQNDWRATQTIAGSRVDQPVRFLSNGWGTRSSVGLTHGSDSDWQDFSVQWDGVIVVHRPVLLGTKSDDGSRMWIDLDGNGTFGSTGPEFLNNAWGVQQPATVGPPSPTIPAGAYLIRIQYHEDTGDNTFSLVATEPVFDLFTSASLTTPGLVGSYVNRSLRSDPTLGDWRVTQTISGTRVDSPPDFTSQGWGTRASLGLTGGASDASWDNFSVQWDGYVRINKPTRLATLSNDGSRLWIDVNEDDTFGPTAPEFYNNNWGSAQNFTIGEVSRVLPPGVYRIRAQYEEGTVLNSFLLAGARTDDPVSDNAGYALCFDGFDDFVTLDRLVSGDFTIEFWFQTIQVADSETAWWVGRGLVDATALPTPSSPFYDGFGVTLGNGKVLFGTGGGFETTIRSGFVADGAWHHVAATRVMSSGAMALYVDGVRVATGTGSLAPLNAASQMTFGRSQWGGGYFRGALDEVRIWNIARSSGEIQGSYRCTEFSHPNLLSYWLMNEGSGSQTVSDHGQIGVLRQGVGWMLSGAPVMPVSAASLVVQNLDDSGSGSLREAVCAANLLSGSQTVTFAPALSGGTIRLTSGQLNFFKTGTGIVTLTSAPLPAGIVISGEGSQRIFKVWPGTSVVLDSLTISNGVAAGGSDVSGSGGGGAHNEGNLTVRRCTFVDNKVSAPTMLAYGGAIEQQSGALAIEHSTFFRNTVEGQSGYGGALDINAGNVTIRHSTFTRNRLIASAGTQRGSDIFLFGSSSAVMRIGHTIVAANTPTTRPNVAVAGGAIISEGYNLIGDGTGSSGWDNTRDLVGTTGGPFRPWLSSLKMSGGPTPVCLPLGGSPALDAGDPLFVTPATSDQRGYPRVAGGRIDIGAVETCLRAFYTFDLQTALDETETSTATYEGNSALWDRDHLGQFASAFDVAPSYADRYRLQTLAHAGNASLDLGLKDSFTVSVWLNPRTVDADKMVLGSTGNGGSGTLHLGLRDGRAYFGFWGNDLPGNRAIPINRWTHLAWVYQAHGQLMSIYVNGQLDASTIPRSNTTKNGDVFVGFCEALPASYFNGQIDDFAIFCDSLAANQIAALATDTVRPDGILPPPSLPLPPVDPCNWVVREVFNHSTQVNDLVSAEYAATTPSLGVSIEYSARTIQRNDPEAPGFPMLFSGALPYACNNRTLSSGLTGNDDYFVLSARTIVHIVDEADYTFAFRTDDGARLRVRGATFISSISPYGGNPAVPPHRGDTLASPGNISLSETYGVTHLRPGDYEVEFLTWEASGAAFCEVYAARGAKTGFDQDFRPLSRWSFARPRLIASRTLAGFTLSWSLSNGCQRLQCAPTVLGPWTDCANQANPQTISGSSPPSMQFFRVVQ